MFTRHTDELHVVYMYTNSKRCYKSLQQQILGGDLHLERCCWIPFSWNEFLQYIMGPEKVITSEKLFLLFRCRSGLERDKHASGTNCQTVEQSILIHFSFAALDLKVFIAILKDHLSP